MSNEQSAVVGRVLGRYQLLSSIARGGMGQVWLGRLHGARGFHKLVAIKTLLGASDEAGRMESMLLEEARIAALIHHPNVVQTIELGEDDGMLFMVMEWVDGEPLSAVLTEARERGVAVPMGVSANLVAQTLRGLHAAHELCDDSGTSLGVVHRDVSPHNVLVSYAGAAKLLDFGIAKATKGKSNQTVTGEVKGKFAYMAPEQVLGTSIDRRTDLFAAGIMLYTLTAGRHPFKHHNDAGVLHAITSDQPAPPPSSFLSSYPRALEAVVMKAIDKDINGRFATAEDMRLALERAVPGALATGDAEVRRFVGELLAERALSRREAVRRILLRADSQTPGSGTHPVLVSGQSAGSLRGFAVDRSALETDAAELAPGRSVQRVDSKLPLVRSRKRYQLAMLGAVAIAAVAVLIAVRSASSRLAAAGPGAPVTHAAMRGAEEGQRAVVSHTLPPEAQSPPPAARTESAELSAAPAASVPPVARLAPKAKHGAKPAGSAELIAPDYAR